MKKVLLILVTMWIICPASGQIVLYPGVLGHHYRHYHRTELCSSANDPLEYPFIFSDSGHIQGALCNGISTQNGYTVTYYQQLWSITDLYVRRGILEFVLHAAKSNRDLPTSGMTPYNWTAKLHIEKLPLNGGVNLDTFGVDLFSLTEEDEDSELTDHETEGHFITHLYDNPPPAGAEFTIDVTEALRIDLFGSSSNVTTGFILKPTQLATNVAIDSIFCWNGSDVNLTIHPTWVPYPTPTATATPSQPCDNLEVHLTLTAKLFRAGDYFILWRSFCNPGEERRLDVFVALNIMDEYWFYPYWTSRVQSTQAILPPGYSDWDLLLSFIWPDDAGQMSGLHFLAVCKDPYSGLLVSNIEDVVWGFE